LSCRPRRAARAARRAAGPAPRARARRARARARSSWCPAARRTPRARARAGRRSAAATTAPATRRSMRHWCRRSAAWAGTGAGRGARAIAIPRARRRPGADRVALVPYCGDARRPPRCLRDELHIVYGGRGAGRPAAGRPAPLPLEVCRTSWSNAQHVAPTAPKPHGPGSCHSSARCMREAACSSPSAVAWLRALSKRTGLQVPWSVCVRRRGLAPMRAFQARRCGGAFPVAYDCSRGEQRPDAGLA